MKTIPLVPAEVCAGYYLADAFMIHSVASTVAAVVFIDQSMREVTMGSKVFPHDLSGTPAVQNTNRTSARPWRTLSIQFTLLTHDLVTTVGIVLAIPVTIGRLRFRI